MSPISVVDAFLLAAAVTCGYHFANTFTQLVLGVIADVIVAFHKGYVKGRDRK